MTDFTTRIRTVPCHKGKKGYQALIEFRHGGELHSFEGSLYERRWAADNDAQRMADRIDAYVEIVAAQNS